MGWLGISLGLCQPRHSSGGTPTPTPVTKLIIEGDSMFYAGGDGNGGGVWAYRDVPPSGKTVVPNVEGSRIIGGTNPYAGPPSELASNTAVTPANNSLILQRPTDIATGAQALMFMIGTNDLTAFAIGHYEQDLIEYAGPIRAAGTKLYWSFPVPMRSDKAYDSGAGAGAYDAWMAKRASRMVQWRNPAVWGQWADGYWPLGEQPDFNLADNTLYIASDGVHPTQLGQDTFFAYMKAIGDSLFDNTRIGSTSIYSARWPADPVTNLTPSTTYTFRIIVSGLDPAGTALGASISGATSPTLSLNGATPGTSCATGSGNGYRLYNGDTLDFFIPLSAANNTPVTADIQIGGETRTRTFRTVAAVTPATLSPVGFLNDMNFGASHTMSGTFAAAGLYLLYVYSTDSGSQSTSTLTVGGASATRLTYSLGSFSNSVIAFIVNVTTTGTKSVVFTGPSAFATCVVHYSLVNDADPTPVAVSPATPGTAPSNEGDPHVTESVTIPASGLAVGAMGESASGNSSTSGTVNTGTTFVAESHFYNAGQNGTEGLVVGKRGVGSGVTLSFNYAFGNWGRVAVVFKALGT